MTENADLLSRVQNVQQQLQSSEREKQKVRQELIRQRAMLTRAVKRQQQLVSLVCYVWCVLSVAGGPPVTAGD